MQKYIVAIAFTLAASAAHAQKADREVLLPPATAQDWPEHFRPQKLWPARPIPSDFATFKIPKPFASCFRILRALSHIGAAEQIIGAVEQVPGASCGD